jgi:hypothetical protein
MQQFSLLILLAVQRKKEKKKMTKTRKRMYNASFQRRHPM